MAKTETLEDFYKFKLNDPSGNLRQGIGQFNVFRIQDQVKANTVSPTYIRRDFYKIMLFEGENVFHYGDRSIGVKGNTLLFFNPHVPYTYDPLTSDTAGYFCVFKDEFFKENLRLNVGELPLFKAGAQPVFTLGCSEAEEVGRLFEKMFSELKGSYDHKYELIKVYVLEIVYLAMKQPTSGTLFKHPDASSRITAVFLELLERQFPIESISQRFELRSPKLIADRLSIHVNYLNRAIKKATGRTTTDLIFERLTGEAKALLKHTEWNIAEISHVLGFEDQAHFNNFFKKQTRMNPSEFRKS